MMLPVEVHKMEFHQKLKLLREQRGLTQEELAEQLDITRQSVSKWELGINEPDLPTIRALCKILDCSYDALLGEEEVTAKEAEPGPKEEPKPLPSKRSVYVAEIICLSIYLISGIVFAFCPFFLMPNVVFNTMFSIVFGGVSNMNMVALLSLFVWHGGAATMAVLSFLPRRPVWLFQVRDGLFMSNAALLFYCLSFAIQTNCVGIGLVLLFLGALTFLVLHLAVPSLRCRGFAKIYGENQLKVTPVDGYVLASTLMIVLGLLSLIRVNPGETTFMMVAYWITSLLCLIAVTTFAVLFLALPSSYGRKGIKVGAMISLVAILAGGIAFSAPELMPTVIFYWLYVVGVFVAVCLCKTSKKEAVCN